MEHLHSILPILNWWRLGWRRWPTVKFGNGYLAVVGCVCHIVNMESQDTLKLHGAGYGVRCIGTACRIEIARGRLSLAGRGSTLLQNTEENLRPRQRKGSRLRSRKTNA